MHRVGARPRPFPRRAHKRTRAPRPREGNRTSSTHESRRRCRSQRERKADGLPPTARTPRGHTWQSRGPNLPADPIGDLAVTLQVEARNVTHNSTVDLDDPVRRGGVAPQPRPPSLEGRSIIGLRRSERRHPYSLAIPRVLEQHAEITIFDLAKDKLSRALPPAIKANCRKPGDFPNTGPGEGNSPDNRPHPGPARFEARPRLWTIRAVRDCSSPIKAQRGPSATLSTWASRLPVTVDYEPGPGQPDRRLDPRGPRRTWPRRTREEARAKVIEERPRRHTRRGETARSVGLGVLVAPGLPEEISTRIADDLAGTCARRTARSAGGRSSSSTGSRSRRPDSPARRGDAARAARAGWDFAVVVTDLPLRHGSRPVSVRSRTQGGGLVSLPALGPLHLKRRLRLVLRELARSLSVRELAASDRRRCRGFRRSLVPTVISGISAAGGNGAREPALALGGKALRRARRGICRGSLRHRGVRHMTALGSAQFVAAPGRVPGLACGDDRRCDRRGRALGARARSARPRPVLLFNVTTALTVTIGIASLYAALFVLVLAGAVLMIAAPVLADALGRDTSARDYVTLAWIAAPLPLSPAPSVPCSSRTRPSGSRLRGIHLTRRHGARRIPHYTLIVQRAANGTLRRGVEVRHTRVS